jgi:leucine-rich repeat protein SHOC2
MPEVPDVAWTCVHVTSLTLKNNELTELSAAIGRLAALQTLDLSENKLAELPAELGECGNLTALNISENKLKALPATIGKLAKLETLQAFKNELSALPAEIGGCVALTEVNCFNNKLIKLPPSFASLANLVNLNVGGNKLKTLPKTDQWTSLEEFRCHQNTLIMLPSFAGLTSLTFLKMDMNRVLGAVPEFGDGLTSLTHLEINNCDFTELPDTIKSMTALRTFNVQSNKVTAMCELPPSLATLNMNGNPIAALGPIVHCPDMTVLFFSECKVAELDSGLAGLKKLQRVIAKGNPCAKGGGQSGPAAGVLAAMEATCVENGGWLKQ